MVIERTLDRPVVDVVRQVLEPGIQVATVEGRSRLTTISTFSCDIARAVSRARSDRVHWAPLGTRSHFQKPSAR